MAAFVQRQPKHSLICDAGCGNGKNLPVCGFGGIGCDFSVQVRIVLLVLLLLVLLPQLLPLLLQLLLQLLELTSLLLIQLLKICRGMGQVREQSSVERCVWPRCHLPCHVMVL